MRFRVTTLSIDGYDDRHFGWLYRTVLTLDSTGIVQKQMLRIRNCHGFEAIIHEVVIGFSPKQISVIGWCHDGKHEDPYVTVSYTHLTLPTICSV